jgi:hypothetical protein
MLDMGYCFLVYHAISVSKLPAVQVRQLTCESDLTSKFTGIQESFRSLARAMTHDLAVKRQESDLDVVPDRRANVDDAPSYDSAFLSLLGTGSPTITSLAERSRLARLRHPSHQGILATAKNHGGEMTAK